MNWQESDRSLQKTFKAKNFTDLMEKLNRVALVAEAMQHHPDFEVFSYNNVKFRLSTHDSSAITEKDYELAKKIDAIFDL